MRLPAVPAMRAAIGAGRNLYDRRGFV